jgi:DHA1 family bicyclomycin/chloramphenicol resistance-like MFS transporter
MLMSPLNLALVANNIGLMWVAVEVATLTTVLMVGIYRTHEALEAAWKYFILGSVGIALALPETRRVRSEDSNFRRDVGSLIRGRAFIGYVLCQVLASQIIFTFAGGGPYIVVTQMGRTSAEYGAWFATTGFAYLVGNLLCVRFAPRHSLERLIWFGLALQLGGSLLNLAWSIVGLNQAPLWLFGTQMIVMAGNAFVMANSAAGAISVRPEAAGTASGAMGFLQQGIGSLVSQFGAYLGGHSTTTLPLTTAILIISIACASSMIFLVPRRKTVVSEEMIEEAEEDEAGVM